MIPLDTNWVSHQHDTIEVEFQYSCQLLVHHNIVVKSLKGTLEKNSFFPNHKLVFVFPISCIHIMLFIYHCSQYSQSSPCDHSRKRPALVTTTFVNSRLNCNLSFVMKSSCKRPLPKATAIVQLTFPLFLSSCK